MTHADSEILQGTLDLLILKTLSLAALHGWGIAQRIEQLSRGALHVQPGSLYPALQRLRRQGLLDPESGIAPNGRETRYYRLTAAGRRRLQHDQGAWERNSGAVNLILRAV